MRKLVLAVALLFISPIAAADNVNLQSSAQASSQGGTAFGGNGGSGGAGGMASSISQGGTGFGGDGGQAYSAGGAGGIGSGTGGNASNSQSLHFDQVRQSPAVFMGAPMPTAPCQTSIGGFLSFIGGAGFAYSRTLQECEKRETARLAHGIGQSDMALELLCMTEYGAKTSSCKDARQ